MAKELEREGFHILAIKDMAGLLKPKAANELLENYDQQSIYQFICIHMIRVEMAYSRINKRLMQVLILLIQLSRL